MALTDVAVALTGVVVVIKAEDIALSLVEFQVPHIKGRFIDKSTSPRGSSVSGTKVRTVLSFPSLGEGFAARNVVNCDWGMIFAFLVFSQQDRVIWRVPLLILVFVGPKLDIVTVMLHRMHLCAKLPLEFLFSVKDFIASSTDVLGDRDGSSLSNHLLNLSLISSLVGPGVTSPIRFTIPFSAGEAVEMISFDHRRLGACMLDTVFFGYCFGDETFNHL